jgi:hypothetical protein
MNVSERNGVRIGQEVRDLDGDFLGRVTELYEGGFSVVKGLPFLFRSDLVARYDEVREVSGGRILLARSKRDLFELANGGMPPSWRVPAAAPGRPVAATPSEASGERGVPGTLAPSPAR